MLQKIFDKQNILPNPSCHTSTVWPLVQNEVGNSEINSLQVGYDIGCSIIQPQIEKNWDDIMNQVLSQYQEVWERLAEL